MHTVKDDPVVMILNVMVHSVGILADSVSLNDLCNVWTLLHQPHVNMYNQTWLQIIRDNRV